MVRRLFFDIHNGRSTIYIRTFQSWCLLRKQWDEERNGKASADISAGGVIDELWHNRKYVFAMSSRYNAADEVKGWREVADIIATNYAAHLEPTLYPNP